MIDPINNVEIVAQVLREYGNAIRGDWGRDGRTCRDELWSLGECLSSTEPLIIKDVRSRAGVCVNGGGHWPDYCEDYGCPTLVEGDAR